MDPVVNLPENGALRLPASSRPGATSSREDWCVSPAAGNALKHGLTAQTVLPPALRAAVRDHLQRLRRELPPATHTEDLLVREIARHAACLDLRRKPRRRC